ncbi:hypothetical protein BC828DRAFT_390064 [Blastocladiella britannica]|nr:hypothetical protein BC828DRAFT_390064 [Blastocladiella britannica]
MEAPNTPAPSDTDAAPNLGNWTQHDRDCLINAISRIPRWNLAAIAAAVDKPIVQVLWHLSALSHHASVMPAVTDVIEPVEIDAADEAMETSADEIALEEAASEAAARKLEVGLRALDRERPLLPTQLRSLLLIRRRRAEVLASEHLHGGTPVHIMADAWLDLLTKLRAHLCPLIHLAILEAEHRVQQSHTATTVAVVDEITGSDVRRALAAAARTRSPAFQAALESGDRRRKQWADWWELEYEPAHPGFQDEAYSAAHAVFRRMGVDLDDVHRWRPEESAAEHLARLEVAVQCARTRRRAADAGRGDRLATVLEDQSDESPSGSSDGDDGRDADDTVVNDKGKSGSDDDDGEALEIPLGQERRSPSPTDDEDNDNGDDGTDDKMEVGSAGDGMDDDMSDRGQSSRKRPPPPPPPPLPEMPSDSQDSEPEPEAPVAKRLRRR